MTYPSMPSVTCCAYATDNAPVDATAITTRSNNEYLRFLEFNELEPLENYIRVKMFDGLRM